MKYSSKFDVVFEETMFRFTQGGLLEGDYVKLRVNYRNNPKIKEKSSGFLDRLDYMANIDLPLKISAIKAERAEVSNGVVGAVDAPTNHWADVIVEYAPGLWTNVITLPLEILEKVDTGNNFSPGIPPSTVRADTTQIEPHEVKQQDPNRNMAQKNTTLKFS